MKKKYSASSKDKKDWADFTKQMSNISVKEGDFLAITNVGAYGASLSSNYNVRPKIAEIMVNDTKTKLISKRQSLENLINN